MKKRKFAIFLAVFTVLIFGGWFVSTFVPEVRYLDLKTKKVKDEIKIAVISDLHGMKFDKDNEKLYKLIKAENPDIIAVLGDMYTNGDDTGRKTAISFLSSLTKINTVLFVNGEHDNDKNYMKTLSENGVKILCNKTEVIKIKNTEIRFYGISNVYYPEDFDLSSVFKKDDEHYSVLLAHIPNFEKFSSFGVDLSLCGDTHGEMIRLPFVGAIYSESEDKWFPDLNGSQTKGLYESENSKMYITSGIGNYPFPLRFCNRPEIAVIKIRPENP